jgi:hypothetical protein
MVRLAAVTGVAHVAVERLDVVAVGVEEEGSVVPRPVVAMARRAVRAVAPVDARSMERVDGFT